MKIPANTDLFKSVYFKRKTEKIQFDITVNYKKGFTRTSTIEGRIHKVDMVVQYTVTY